MWVPNVLREMRESGSLGFAKVGRQFKGIRGDDPDTPVNPITVWRWHTIGLLTPSGRRVRLEAVRVGRSLATSQAAVDRFIAALNATPNADSVEQPATRAASNNADAALEAAGF